MTMPASDDEAFVRTIVGAPGDDAPRLVYADWLDERHDPRGAYLRAEGELFRRRPASTEAAVAHAGLREQATGLDPVWVARVSRPPVGVCCTHVRLTDPGPRLTAAELEAAGGRLGLDLSAEYRAFLLNYNGGTPAPNHFRFRESDPDDYAELQRFFAVYPPGTYPPDSSWLEDLVLAAGVLKGGGFPFHVIADYLPIGRAGEDSYLLLQIRGPDVGSVWHFADYTHSSDEPDHLRPVARTLGAFIAGLADYDPEWVKHIWDHDLPGLVRWLDGGGDPNAVHVRTGASAVGIATVEAQWEMVAELLERGADLPRGVRQRIDRHGPESLRRLVRERGRE